MRVVGLVLNILLTICFSPLIVAFLISAMVERLWANRFAKLDELRCLWGWDE